MKKHILLIDGDKDGLKFFVEALNLTGVNYKCTWASGGEEAVGQLQYITPDIIFISLNTAGIDAFGIVAHAMQQMHLANSPVVLYANMVTKEIAAKAMALGVAACITKPGDTHALADILKDILHLEEVMVENN